MRIVKMAEFQKSTNFYIITLKNQIQNNRYGQKMLLLINYNSNFHIILNYVRLVSMLYTQKV